MREELQTYIDKIPEVAKAAGLEETFWINEKKIPHGEKAITRVSPSQIEDASRRLKRFAPYLKTVFRAQGNSRDEGASKQRVGSGHQGPSVLKDGQPSARIRLRKGQRRHLRGS